MDEAWNYCVGWNELIWDWSELREHFATIVSMERFDQIAEAAERGEILPLHLAVHWASGRREATGPIVELRQHPAAVHISRLHVEDFVVKTST